MSTSSSNADPASTQAFDAKLAQFSATRLRVSQQSAAAMADLTRLQESSVTGLDLKQLELRLQSLEGVRLRYQSFTVSHQKDGETLEAFQDRQLVVLKRDLAGMAFLERQYQKCQAAVDWYLNRSSQPAA